MDETKKGGGVVVGLPQKPEFTLSVVETGNNAILMVVCMDAMKGLEGLGDWLKERPKYFIASMQFNAVNLPQTIATPKPVVAMGITVVAELRPPIES